MGSIHCMYTNCQNLKVATKTSKIAIDRDFKSDVSNQRSYNHPNNVSDSTHVCTT